MNSYEIAAKGYLTGAPIYQRRFITCERQSHNGANRKFLHISGETRWPGPASDAGVVTPR
jgi:hypothetical protein